MKAKVAWRTMVKAPLPISFLERRDGRRMLSDSESFGAGASLAPRLCQRITLGPVNDWKGSSFSQVQQLADVRDSTRDRSRRPVKTRPRLAGVTWPIWDPTLSSGRIGPKRLRARFFQVVFLANEGETDGNDFHPVPQYQKPSQICEIHFPPNFPCKNWSSCKGLQSGLFGYLWL